MKRIKAKLKLSPVQYRTQFTQAAINEITVSNF